MSDPEELIDALESWIDVKLAYEKQNEPDYTWQEVQEKRDQLAQKLAEFRKDEP